MDSVASSAPAWLLLVIVLTASVTEELLFRAYPIEHLARLTGKRWPGALLSLAAFVAIHLQGWNLGHVIGVVLPVGRSHDRPLPVAAQSHVHDHYAFLP